VTIARTLSNRTQIQWNTLGRQLAAVHAVRIKALNAIEHSRAPSSNFGRSKNHASAHNTRNTLITLRSGNVVATVGLDKKTLCVSVRCKLYVHNRKLCELKNALAVGSIRTLTVALFADWIYRKSS
jgi:hypothetical protein